MKKEKITIAFASVIEALFLLLEIYFMIHAKGNFPVFTDCCHLYGGGSLLSCFIDHRTEPEK